MTAIFFTRLADTGVFDAGWSTAVGGPYGISAAIAGLALAAGLRLTDVVVPVDDFLPDGRRWFSWAVRAVVALSILAFLGLPGAAFLSEFVADAKKSGLVARLIEKHHVVGLSVAP